MRTRDPKPPTQELLAGELDELSARLDRIGAQVRLLGGHREALEVQDIAPVHEPEPRQPAAPAAAEPAPSEPVPSGPTVGERLRATVHRDGFSNRLIAWVGGAVTLVGLVLALALAIQRGYLGPAPRVLGGLLLSAALLGGALRLHRTPSGRPGAFALAATGIAGSYLDVIAATTLYGFLPDYAGLLLGFAIAVAGLGLAGRWDSQPLASFVVLGCVLCAPVLTGGVNAELAGFLLVLKAATAGVQVRRGWPLLGVTAALPALAAAVLAGAFAEPTQPLPVAIIGLVTAALLGTVAVLGVRRRPDELTGYGLLLSAPVPALLAVPMLVDPYGVWLAAAVTAGLLALWAAGRFLPVGLPTRCTALAGGMAAFAVLQTTANFTDGTARTLLLLAEAVLLALVAVRLRFPGALLTALVYAVVGWLQALLTACAPSTLTDGLRSAPPAVLLGGVLAGALGALVAGALVWSGYRLGVLKTPRRAPVPWVLAALGVLYGSAAAVLNTALLAAPSQTGFLAGHVLITLGWTITGLPMLVRFGDSLLGRIAGLMLAGAAVAKLALFDLAALDGLARVTVALGAGLALLVVGARYSRDPHVAAG